MNNDYPNVVIAGVWYTKNGHANTMPLDQRAIDTLTKVVKDGVGGKFLIRKRSEESLAKSKNPDTAPPCYLEFVPAEEVERFNESRSKRSGL